MLTEVVAAQDNTEYLGYFDMIFEAYEDKSLVSEQDDVILQEIAKKQKMFSDLGDKITQLIDDFNHKRTPYQKELVCENMSILYTDIVNKLREFRRNSYRDIKQHRNYPAKLESVFARAMGVGSLTALAGFFSAGLAVPLVVLAVGSAAVYNAEGFSLDPSSESNYQKLYLQAQNMITKYQEIYAQTLMDEIPATTELMFEQQRPYRY